MFSFSLFTKNTKVTLLLTFKITSLFEFWFILFDKYFTIFTSLICKVITRFETHCKHLRLCCIAKPFIFRSFFISIMRNASGIFLRFSICSALTFVFVFRKVMYCIYETDWIRNNDRLSPIFFLLLRTTYANLFRNEKTDFLFNSTHKQKLSFLRKVKHIFKNKLHFSLVLLSKAHSKRTKKNKAKNTGFDQHRNRNT